MTLSEETRDLAKRLRAEADRLDESFTQIADSRALQGGAICEEADDYRKFARKIFAVAREMNELE